MSRVEPSSTQVQTLECLSWQTRRLRELKVCGGRVVSCGAIVAFWCCNSVCSKQLSFSWSSGSLLVCSVVQNKLGELRHRVPCGVVTGVRYQFTLVAELLTADKR